MALVPLSGPGPGAASALRRLVATAFGLTLALAALDVLVDAVRPCNAETLWDDAFMFARYARNLLAEGRIAWNPGGDAVYGPTSLGYLLLVASALLLSGDRPALALAASSELAGLAFLVLLAVLVLRHVDGRPGTRRALLALVAFLLAGSRTTSHFASGMDTTSALSLATIQVIAAHRVALRPSRAAALVLGGVGASAYLVRPELLLFSFLLPASLWLWSPEPRVRRAAAIAAAATVLGLGLEVGACAACLGTPLPLGYYAKTSGLYGEALRTAFRGIATRELLRLVQSYWPLLLLVLLVLPGLLRPSRRPASPVLFGALLGSVLLIAYHLFFVLPIMAYSARFQQPVLPALVYVAGGALERIRVKLERAGASFAGGAGASVALGATGLAWFALVPACIRGLLELQTAVHQGEVLDFDLRAAARVGWPKTNWFRLNAVSRLPDDVVLAATEVGWPGVLAPRKTIVDLTGLNEPAFAVEPFSARRLFSLYRPDWIYLPHPSYEAMTRELLESPEAAAYEVYAAQDLGVELGVAIRRDSPRFDAMRRILAPHEPEGR